MKPMQLTHAHRRLLDGWQRGFPLSQRPFAEIAAALQMSESEVLARLGELCAAGVVSRIGATVRPNTVGASLLAAMRVPPDRLEKVAAIVSAEACVNHNYEREHTFNLWFVVTATDRDRLADALTRLRVATGLDILELPMERAYYLDLGFPIDLSGSCKAAPEACGPSPPIDAQDRRLLAALEDGIRLESRPYQGLADRCAMTESGVVGRLGRLLTTGIITRLGLIVRHRALGISANAMAVWDIDDGDVDRVGRAFAASPHVTLCYRRPRRLPAWPYNLFTMIHGRDRRTVEAQLATLADQEGVPANRRAVLFSRRCFVQRGARYKAA